MRVEIPRVQDNADGWQHPGPCYLVHVNDETGEPDVVYFRCNRGHTGALVKHSIAANGEVNASILCPGDCGYHEWGTLVDCPVTQEAGGRPQWKGDGR